MYGVLEGNGSTAEPYYLVLEGGVQYGPARKYRVVQRNLNFLAIRVPGHRYFGGQSQPQHYAPACFTIFARVNRDSALPTPGELWHSVLTVPLRS